MKFGNYNPDFSHLANVFGEDPKAQARRIMWLAHLGIWTVSLASTIVIYAAIGNVYKDFFASEWARRAASASYFFLMLAFYYGLRAFLNNLIYFSARHGAPWRWPGLEAGINIFGFGFVAFFLAIGISIGIDLLRFQAKLVRSQNAIEILKLPHIVALKEQRDLAVVSYNNLLGDPSVGKFSESFARSQGEVAKAQLAQAKATSALNQTARELLASGDPDAILKASSVLGRVPATHLNGRGESSRLLSLAEGREKKLGQAKRLADSLSAKLQMLIAQESTDKAGKSEADLVEEELGFSVLNYIAGFGEGAQVVTTVLLLLLGYLATGTIRPSRIDMPEREVKTDKPKEADNGHGLNEPEPVELDNGRVTPTEEIAEAPLLPLSRPLADYMHLLDVIAKGQADTYDKIQEASELVPPGKRIPRAKAHRMVAEILESEHPKLIELRRSWNHHGQTLGAIFRRKS